MHAQKVHVFCHAMMGGLDETALGLPYYDVNCFFNLCI